MKALKIGLIVVVVLFVLVVGAAAFLVNSVISGAQKDRITAMASKMLGTNVTLDSYGLDWGSLLRLQPAVTVNGLKIANPQGFPQRNMLEATQVDLSLDLKSALDRKVEIRSLVVEKPRILIDAPDQGPTNLQVLVDNLKKSDTAQGAPAQGAPAQGAPAQGAPAQGAPAQPASQKAGADSASPDGKEVAIGVTSVSIHDGVILLASAPDPKPTEVLKSVDLTISDIRPGSPSKLDLSAKAFNSANTDLKVGGMIGPLGGAGLPLDGKVDITLALAEFPDAIRKRFLGELASAPGPDSRINLDLAMKGDLYGSTSGTGKIDFSKFLIGSGTQNRLGLGGQAPLAIRAEKLISGGEIELKSNNATLNLGSGQWAGNLNLVRRGTNASGAIAGAIRNVDVNQMLTSFASSPDVVYGALTIPQFRIGFQGDSADGIKRSLNGNGSLRIDNGRFKGLSVLAAVERALGGAPSGTGEFAKFQSNFAIQNQTLALNGIDVDGPGITLTGQGTVGFNETLNFRLQSKLVGNAANLLKARTGGYVSDVAIPVQIAGTVNNPQIRPEVGGIAKSAAKSAIENVLGNFLGKKKKQ